MRKGVCSRLLDFGVGELSAETILHSRCGSAFAKASAAVRLIWGLGGRVQK